MSKGFKITLIILAVLVIIDVGSMLVVYPLVDKNVRGQMGPVKFMMQAPIALGVLIVGKTIDARCAISGGKMQRTSCGNTCLHKLSDAGKTCRTKEDCLGQCMVVMPDMSKVSVQVSGASRNEPRELANCKMNVNEGYVDSYKCPTTVNIVAQCSEYNDPYSNWIFDNGVIKSPFYWATCT
ncbi:MAG: hypothetical protein NTW66_01290 [Candidatus Magasanikbacteria bacterium]|nr:hypothetical protein [Candidatus Magasanikbacteria bacterium]